MKKGSGMTAEEYRLHRRKKAREWRASNKARYLEQQRLRRRRNRLLFGPRAYPRSPRNAELDRERARQYRAANLALVRERTRIYMEGYRNSKRAEEKITDLVTLRNRKGTE